MRNRSTVDKDKSSIEQVSNCHGSRLWVKCQSMLTFFWHHCFHLLVSMWLEINSVLITNYHRSMTCSFPSYAAFYPKSNKTLKSEILIASASGSQSRNRCWNNMFNSWFVPTMWEWGKSNLIHQGGEKNPYLVSFFTCYGAEPTWHYFLCLCVQKSREQKNMYDMNFPDYRQFSHLSFFSLAVKV